jgi:hypothetical protein
MELNPHKKSVSKIQMLLQSKDIDTIETGIAIVAGLDDETLIDVLLEGISYKDNKIVYNKLFKGKEFTQPYLNLALLGILNCAASFPKWKAFNEEITSLSLKVFRLNYFNQFPNLVELDIAEIYDCRQKLKLPKLEKLSLSFKASINFDFDFISNCKILKDLSIYGGEKAALINGLNGIENFNDLNKLIIRDVIFGQTLSLFQTRHCLDLENLTLMSKRNIIEPMLQSLSGIESLTNLKELEVVGFEMEDTTALNNLNNLEFIHLEVNKLVVFTPPSEMLKLKNLELSKCKSLKEIKNTRFPLAINSLDLSLTNLEAIPELTGLKTIDIFKIDNCLQLKDLYGLREVETIGKNNKLDFSGCPNIEHLDGIAHLSAGMLEFDFEYIPKNIPYNKIKGLRLASLKTLEGIEQFRNLEKLVLFDDRRNGADIKELLPLKNLQHLTYLYLGNCQQLRSLDGIENKHFKVLDISENIRLSDTKALDLVTCDLLYIAMGLKKSKNRFPEHLQRYINNERLPDYNSVFL